MEHDPYARGQQLRVPVRFVGSGSEYFRIWITNLLLTLVTLGFYYPYAKARRLRYFHAATEVGGQPLSFHGNPNRMLRGYLLVGLLALVYAAAGRASPLAGLVAFLIVAALWPALWQSSLRFRLSNTGWRGLRLRFDGSVAGAYLAMLPGFVAVAALLTLSWLAEGAQSGKAPPVQVWLPLALLPLVLTVMAPWLFWLLRRYQHQHYALGSERARFDVRVRAFYGLALRTFGVTLLAGVPLGVLVALAAAMLVPLSREAAGGTGTAPDALLANIAGVLLSFLVMQVVVRSYAVARLQNLVWNGTHSANIGFDSRLTYGAMVGLALRNWLLVMLTLGLYYPFAAVATARLRLQAVDVLTTVPLDQLLAESSAAPVAAAGEAAGDLFGLDIGL